ncbi:AraC family transcriptional regulator [Opitutaceae bacterium EW11]|nr:AraC family transcriptional regulator [Opitutaceae bacterium EW11]
MAKPTIPPPPLMSNQVADARRFYLDQRPKRNTGFAVVCGGWERCAADYEIRRQRYPYLTLEFVVGGKGTVALGGRTYALSRGAVFAYGPRMPHVIRTHPEDRLSKYFVNFCGTEVQGLMRTAGVAAGGCYAVESVDEVQAAFEHLLSAGRRGTGAAARIAALEGQILLLMLSEARLPEAARTQQAYQTFSRCRAYLENNYLSLRTAAEAAAACHVAPAYFSRLFARFSGQAPYQLLMRLKMNHAATLLQEGRWMVREIADGFGMDPFHFSRTFKRVHGLSPAGFLRAHSMES